MMMRIPFVLLTTVALSATSAGAAGLKVGQNETKLTQTRISNAGGGAGGNPHWGSAPYQDPYSGVDNILPGENFGEAFRFKNCPDDPRCDPAHYNGYARRGEDAGWDVDPGNAGSNDLGGNAANNGNQVFQ